MSETVVQIHTPFIKLGDFLKFSGLVMNGSDAKRIIQTGEVSVNGETCCIRGKKLIPGDWVSYNGDKMTVE